MKTAGSINDQQIRLAGLGRLHSVINHRRRVAARLMLDQRHLGALGPHSQLIVSSRAEGIAGGKHHTAADLLKAQRQLSHGRRLANAVNAHHEHDHRPAQRRTGNIHFLHQEILEHFAGHGGVLDLLLLHAAAQLVNDLGAGAYAHVGQKQNVRQFLVKVLVDFHGIFNQLVHAFGQIAARFGQTLLESGKKAHTRASYH